MGTDALAQSVRALPAVGPAREEQLRRLGVGTVRDLLYLLPRAYEDLSDVRPIAELSEGSVQTAAGEVVEVNGRHLADGRTLVSVVLADGRDCLEGVWFNQPYAASRLRYGQRVAFSGKPRRYRGHWQMNAPRVREADGDGGGGVVPVYPLTEGLRADQLRALIRRAVTEYAGLFPEVVPEELLRRHGMPGVSEALRGAHLPGSVAEAEAARQRLAYEELLVLQAALAVRRRELRDRLRAPVLVVSDAVDARIRRLFPFRLTEGQERAVADVRRDLAGSRPMQRLLQADVGAGKTAVAAYALLAAVANKHQAALLAPTEVLARQHWETLETYLAHSSVRRLLMTGGLTPAVRRRALGQVAAGEVDLVVGTQALLQADVEFARLGVVVVDEQHRFGVSQRARVRQLGVDPHYLVMTATPIPRTVALAAFGDLDVSVMRELPPGRRPVRTQWVTPARRDQVYERVRQGLAEGRQGYVICPLAAESDAEAPAATRTHAELSAGPLRGFRVGLLYGGMDERLKDEVMGRFREGRIDVLVATTIVEVGVDVPRATVMVVEQADRFGLSQLHQLRGRVARGAVAGECYLIADPAAEGARERLRAVTRIEDGFAIAEEDFRLRGGGEFFGTRQHGLGEFRVADPVRDAGLLAQARRDAIGLVAADASLTEPAHAALRAEVLARFGATLDLATVG